MTQPVDSSILHEIVRVIDQRRKVPAKVIVKSREYLLTYLEDHQHRLEEAMSRYDRDLLNMLYGQLASKIKYQLLRRVPARAAKAMGLAPAKKAATVAAKAKPTALARAKALAKPKAAKKTVPARKAKAKNAQPKRAKATAKKPAAKAKSAARRAAARPKKKAGGRR